MENGEEYAHAIHGERSRVAHHSFINGLQEVFEGELDRIFAHLLPEGIQNGVHCDEIILP